MRSISDPKDLETAWGQQYTRLAEQFARMLPARGVVVVEVGCGKGQLTIPLAKRIPRLRVIALDRFMESYAGSQTGLYSGISNSRMKARVKVVNSDYRAWLSSQPDSKYDGIISSEFLPEIDSKGTRRFFSECYRVLKASGFTTHSFLSPQPQNARQKRLIEADADPRWTKTPPLEWFSPTRKLVLHYLRLAGFRKLRLIRLKSRLVIRSNAARELLNAWDIKPSYWKSHYRILETDGLEIPDWLIVGGTKLS